MIRGNPEILGHTYGSSGNIFIFDLCSKKTCTFPQQRWPPGFCRRRVVNGPAPNARLRERLRHVACWTQLSLHEVCQARIVHDKPPRVAGMEWRRGMVVENPVNSPVEVKVVQIPWFTRFFYTSHGGWEWDFWTINSRHHQIWMFFFQMAGWATLLRNILGWFFSNKVDKMTCLTPPDLDLLRCCFGQMIFVELCRCKLDIYLSPRELLHWYMRLAKTSQVKWWCNGYVSLEIMTLPGTPRVLMSYFFRQRKTPQTSKYCLKNRAPNGFPGWHNFPIIHVWHIICTYHLLQSDLPIPRTKVNQNLSPDEKATCGSKGGHDLKNLGACTTQIKWATKKTLLLSIILVGL